MQHVFQCCNYFGADGQISEGEVFLDIFVEMVAGHEHVVVLVEGVSGLGAVRSVGDGAPHLRQSVVLG